MAKAGIPHRFFNTRLPLQRSWIDGDICVRRIWHHPERCLSGAHVNRFAPTTASTITNLELAIVQSVSAFIVLIAFVITAAMLLLTLIESYLVVGGGVPAPKDVRGTSMMPSRASNTAPMNPATAR
jgi:hypothetical protein